MPAVVLEIVLGIVVGPSGFGWVRVDSRGRAAVPRATRRTRAARTPGRFGRWRSAIRPLTGRDAASGWSGSRANGDALAEASLGAAARRALLPHARGLRPTRRHPGVATRVGRR